MLKSPNARESILLRQVARDLTGREFLDWMQAQADEMAHRSLAGEGPDMHRVQGASLVLSELVTLMKAAVSRQ